MADCNILYCYVELEHCSSVELVSYHRYAAVASNHIGDCDSKDKHISHTMRKPRPWFEIPWLMLSLWRFRVPIPGSSTRNYFHRAQTHTEAPDKPLRWRWSCKACGCSLRRVGSRNSRGGSPQIDPRRRVETTRIQSIATARVRCCRYHCLFN